MALEDTVYSGGAGTRIPTHELAALTNPNDESGLTTVNTTILGYAADDAEEMFKTEYGETYDSSNTRHILPGVRCLKIVLKHHYGSMDPEKYDAEMKSLRDDAKQFRATSMNRRIGLKTTSELTTPQENTSGQELEPSMHDVWKDVTPEKP